MVSIFTWEDISFQIFMPDLLKNYGMTFSKWRSNIILMSSHEVVDLRAFCEKMVIDWRQLVFVILIHKNRN